MKTKAKPLFGKIWIIGALLFMSIISWMLYDILQREGAIGRYDDVIVMGTNAGFKPFEYKNGNEIVGFDVDIAKEIAKNNFPEIHFSSPCNDIVSLPKYFLINFL